MIAIVIVKVIVIIQFIITILQLPTIIVKIYS